VVEASGLIPGGAPRLADVQRNVAAANAETPQQRQRRAERALVDAISVVPGLRDQGLQVNRDVNTGRIELNSVGRGSRTRPLTDREQQAIGEMLTRQGMSGATVDPVTRPRPNRQRRGETQLARVYLPDTSRTVAR
jgi:hypothetical protein